MTKTKTAILDLPMGENDAGAKTVREYLTKLLYELWEREESFNGKRPFGNSGWQWDVYSALLIGGAITGTLDPDGRVEEFDETMGQALILKAILSLK